MTSAVIAYFGDNARVRAKMAGLANKTTIEPADHQDVVETVFALLRAAGAEALPSGRLGTDLT